MSDPFNHLVQAQMLQVGEVKVNGEMDLAFFSLPLTAGMEMLQTLVGRWNVTVENQDNFPTLPPQRSEASSTIHRRFNGFLLEEEISFSAGAFPQEVRCLFSYDRFQDVFRIGYFDNSTFHLDVLEGKGDKDGIMVTNVPTDTTWSVYGRTYHTREIFSDIQQDSFRIRREISVDGGETWVTTSRLEYSRIEGE